VGGNLEVDGGLDTTADSEYKKCWATPDTMTKKPTTIAKAPIIETFLYLSASRFDLLSVKYSF
jgi:hypothetical protein